MVSSKVQMIPRYLNLKKGSLELEELLNGSTLGELGFSSEDRVIASKAKVNEDIPFAPLVGMDRRLTVQSEKVFSEIFDLYSDDKGQMNRDLCAMFISTATGIKTFPDDS
jgi:ABC-type uncharacterized transport system ATPase subunit